MRRILCLWLPNWPLQRLLAARPELRQRALVLFTKQPRQGDRVVAACPAAQRRGVRLGMPVSEAAAMGHLPLPLGEGRGEGNTPNSEPREKHLVYSPAAGATAAFHCQPHDPQADLAALEQLAQACDRFSPLVGLEASDEPECLLLDITGLGPLFGGEESLTAQVAQMCGQRGYQPRLAVADTVGAAWAIAHFGTMLPLPLGEGRGEGNRRAEEATPHPASPLQGRGVLIIPPGQAAAALAPLPVAALRLAEETVELLHSLGIVQVAQLLSLPREDLRARFGQELIYRLDQATGAMAEVIVAQQSTPEPAAAWPLEYPTAHRETLKQVMAILLRRVANQLATRGHGVLELACRLDASGQGVDLRVGLFQPTALADHLNELVGMQLELLRLPGAVSRVAVAATRIAPLVERQQELFADEPRERRRQLAVLVDRLSSRLGQEQVVRPRLRAEAQPEAAVGYEPLTKLGASRGARGSRARSHRASKPNLRHSRPSADAASPTPIAPRPLRLFFPPLPIEVVAVVPDGPPALFRLAGESQPLTQQWGPERIETAWWRGRTVRRDYYRVETVAGSRFWIFRRLTDGEWFLHGEFE